REATSPCVKREGARSVQPELRLASGGIPNTDPSEPCKIALIGVPGLFRGRNDLKVGGMVLAERDVRLALGIVEAAAATQNGSPFGVELLDALREAIPADSAEYCEWPFHEEPSLHLTSPFDLWADQPEAEEAMAVACRTYPLRDVDRASSFEPLRIADIVPTRAFRRTAFYTLVMRPVGVEHELKLWLPAPPRHSYYFSLVRG